jgi:hypothetical protein
MTGLLADGTVLADGNWDGTVLADGTGRAFSPMGPGFFTDGTSWGYRYDLVARAIAAGHIILSLPCGDQKRQN